jgi:hypothetical protein
MLSNDYKARRLLLRSYPAEEQVSDYARRNNWPFAGRAEEDPEEGTAHEVIWLVTPSQALHYAEDRMTRTAYVMASSWSPELADDLSQQLERDLDVVSFDELLRAAEGAEDVHSLSLAINRLSLAAPREYDGDVFRLISKGLSHADRSVRLASIWAVGFMPWPEYRPILRILANTDPDDRVRETAADLLEAYRLERGDE